MRGGGSGAPVQGQYGPPPGSMQYQPPVVPGAPTQADIRDAQDNKGMAIVAHILFFIPLLTGAHKTSPFVKYHTNHGAALFIVWVVWGIIYAIITAIMTASLYNPATWYSGSWGAWGAASVILGLVWFIPTIFCIIGIVNAAQGRMKPLPLIGRFRIIK
jgi:uncharacterized membrane protein